MKKYFAILALVLSALASHAMAQAAGQDDIDIFKKIDQMPGGEKTPAPSVTSGTAKPPTVITADKEADFDAKLRQAVFIGSVYIQDPQFTLSADKLTVYFKKQSGDTKQNADAKADAKGDKPAALPPKPAAKPSASASPASASGGFERALAEGHVIVTSDRPDSNGGPPTHYVGRGAKVEYNAINGEAILYGWPQVEQGINTIVATSESTVIHLFRDGKMKIDGSHKVNINDPGPGKSLETK